MQAQLAQQFSSYTQRINMIAAAFNLRARQVIDDAVLALKCDSPEELLEAEFAGLYGWPPRLIQTYVESLRMTFSDDLWSE